MKWLVGAAILLGIAGSVLLFIEGFLDLGVLLLIEAGVLLTIADAQRRAKAASRREQH